ncbi:MAG: hypothetical protein M3Y33_08590 [Actinomycetota bacterium]|nr:hypothetical protein [Actinomycetota bacterium]
MSRIPPPPADAVALSAFRELADGRARQYTESQTAANPWREGEQVELVGVGVAQVADAGHRREQAGVLKVTDGLLRGSYADPHVGGQGGHGRADVRPPRPEHQVRELGVLAERPVVAERPERARGDVRPGCAHRAADPTL